MKEYLFRILVLFGLLIISFKLFKSPETPPPTTNIEDLVDIFVDAGFETGEHANDAELLENRMIVMTTDVNSAFSRNLIRKLLLLNRDSSTEPIDLYLRTEGGWEADAFAVIDAIAATKAPVNIHALGEVHSSGCMILAAATGERVVYENTILGYHQLNPDEHKIYADRYTDFWKQVSRIPKSWLRNTNGEMIYFSGAKAIKYGVADRLVAGEPKKKPTKPTKMESGNEDREKTENQQNQNNG